MGKIRVNTIGDESLEQKQKKEAEKRQESKKMAKSEEPIAKSEPISENQPVEKKKTQQKSQSKSKTRSPRYIASKKSVDHVKQYKLSEAIDLLSQMQKAKFDETIELHINTLDKGVSGNVTLPHGT